MGALVTVEGYEGVGLIKFNGNAKHGKAEGKVRIGIQLKDKVSQLKEKERTLGGGASKDLSRVVT